jgi:hypothetical protein
MQKAEICLTPSVESTPVSLGFLQQRKCSVDIRAYELFRPEYGAVNVAFSCEVHDRTRLLFEQQSCYNCTIVNVSVNKLMVLIVLQ